MANIHGGSSSRYARMIRTKRNNRRGDELLREQGVGLTPAWDLGIASDEGLEHAWPQTQRQRNEDTLAAMFCRSARRMEI